MGLFFRKNVGYLKNVTSFLQIDNSLNTTLLSTRKKKNKIRAAQNELIESFCYLVFWQ